ncbi:MAG: hypothetical protein FWG32_01665 [Oscillospiraceae bacterium]|nr:hypothetical protein [Oscillospiraceae bacterium]
MKIIKNPLTALFAFAVVFSLLFAPLSAVCASDKTAEEVASETLSEAGLFRGVGSNAGVPDFALGRTLNRADGLVMLVRLMGAEDEALSGDHPCPFTDVPAWAAPYAGYAFAAGWTKGVSEAPALFDPNASITAAQYLTFILRALGYEDGVDFAWESAAELTDKLGITGGAGGALTRGDMAVISLFALTTAVKGSGQTLLTGLLDAGVFDKLAGEGLIKNETLLKALETGDAEATAAVFTETVSKAAARVKELLAAEEKETAPPPAPSPSPETAVTPAPENGGSFPSFDLTGYMHTTYKGNEVYVYNTFVNGVKTDLYVTAGVHAAVRDNGTGIYMYNFLSTDRDGVVSNLVGGTETPEVVTLDGPYVRAVSFKTDGSFVVGTFSCLVTAGTKYLVIEPNRDGVLTCEEGSYGDIAVGSEVIILISGSDPPNPPTAKTVYIIR